MAASHRAFCVAFVTFSTYALFGASCSSSKSSDETVGTSNDGTGGSGSDSGTANVDVVDSGAVTIVEPNETLGGKTYAEWGAAWHKWLYELPGPNFPVQDDTGEYCSMGQSGGQSDAAAGTTPFFLSVEARTDIKVTRKCTIPAEQPVLIPMTMWAADNGGIPADALLSNGELQSFCTAAAATVTGLNLEIDGHSYGSTLEDFAPYLTLWTQFSYTVPDTPNNFYAMFQGVTFAGSVPVSFSGGYLILLSALPAGLHTIHFTTRQTALSSGIFSAPAHNQDVTYELDVR